MDRFLSYEFANRCRGCNPQSLLFGVLRSPFPPPLRRVPGNVIGPEGVQAVAEAVKGNRTAHTILLGGMPSIHPLPSCVCAFKASECFEMAPFLFLFRDIHTSGETESFNVCSPSSNRMHRYLPRNSGRVVEVLAQALTFGRAGWSRAGPSGDFSDPVSSWLLVPGPGSFWSWNQVPGSWGSCRIWADPGGTFPQ